MKQWLKKLMGTQLTGWKQWLVHAAVILAVLGLGGLLVAASGIVPIKASSGHWAITEWFLQFSKRRSVDLHSKGIKVPPLDDPALVLQGAGHYQIGCFPCHGSPELRHPHVAQSMLPPPPYLADRLSVWDEKELFSIVKHGLKFTGMPAWPAKNRDDEVWAMVAFLQEFPNLDAEEYRRLALGASQANKTAPLTELTKPASTPKRVIEACSACHGVDGQGRGRGAFPKLAGQSKEYLASSLEVYLAGDRHSGIMQTVATGLTTEEIQSLAEYYHGLEPAAAGETPAESSLIEQGEIIAREGVPEDRVPACIDCHGPTDSPRNSAYPILAGQSARYLVLQLELFQKQQRGGGPFAHLMHPVAQQIKPDQIRSVAAYYESLNAAHSQPARAD